MYNMLELVGHSLALPSNHLINICVAVTTTAVLIMLKSNITILLVFLFSVCLHLGSGSTKDSNHYNKINWFN